MPAYAIALDVTCSEPGCLRRATHEVRDVSNRPVRRCCKKHADALVDRLNVDLGQGAVTHRTDIPE